MKRRWFQIHLSTAILLVFVAGGLLWANTCERGVEYILSTGEGGRSLVETRSSDGGPFVDGPIYGWPFEHAKELRELLENQNDYYPALAIQFSAWHLGGNITVAFLILICITVLSERSLRRREARKA